MNEDKTWSIEHEGPLNKNNIVFKTGLVKKSIDTDDYDNAETWEELDKFDNTHESESKDMDDMWVCNYCGSENVFESAFIPMNHSGYENSIPILSLDNIIWPKYEEYTSDCCDSFDYPLRYSEWEEQIIEECNGNKDKYIAILDGSRAWMKNKKH